MRNAFDIQPTEEELLFAKRRFLQGLHFIHEQPFAVYSFSTYWNLTNGGVRSIQHAEFLTDLCQQHHDNAVLLGRPQDNPDLWAEAVSRNRRFVQDLSELQKQELTQFDNYKFWHPALLENDPMSIDSYLQLFPNIAGATDTPAIIWKYENPESPDCLPGAVDIDTHDAIHTLLGRGALQIDEAFVIGFTMGGASNELTDDQVTIFMNALMNEYPKPYNVTPDNIASYLIGVQAGREYFGQTGIDLSKTDFKDQRHKPVGQLRAEFGIDLDKLIEIYRIEANFTQNGRANERNQVRKPVGFNPRKAFG